MSDPKVLAVRGTGRIKWMFTTKKARHKMGRAYPKLSTKES
jgi:hypothetical protein